MNSNRETPQVLLPTECEMFVENLQAFSLEDIGSLKWLTQHEHLEKLNMQAVISANANETEYVKDALMLFDKMSVLMHELISIDLWKKKCFGELFKINFKPRNTFVIYLILYHEATLVNLLETVMYHQEVCLAIGDSILDLIDYCYRKITDFIQNYEQDKVVIAVDEKSQDFNVDLMEELKIQNEKIEFDCVMKCLTISRYIIDNISQFPLSVVNRLLNTHDFILLLVQIMDLQVWTKQENGSIYKYVENKWKKVDSSERFQLTKLEGQVWLSIYQLILNPECTSKYDYTEYKKNQIVKLKSHLNDVIIDQIPNLASLQRFLEQLTIMSPPAYKADLIIEQVPEIYDNLVRKYKGKWKEIVLKQSLSVLDPNENDLRNHAKRWVDTYSGDAMESLIDEPPKCAQCGEEASKRCSRCQNEWYCRRECQVKHWSNHKKYCNLIQETIQQLKVDQV